MSEIGRSSLNRMRARLHYWLRGKRNIAVYGDSLNTAISEIGSDDVTLVIDTAVTLTANIASVPSNITIEWVYPGKIIFGNYSITTWSAPFANDPLWQIFDYTGTGTVTFGSGVLPHVRPEWWGAKADGSTDSGPAFRRLFATIGHGTNVLLLGGVYSIASTGSYTINTTTYDVGFTIQKRSIRVVGTGCDNDPAYGGTVVKAATSMDWLCNFGGNWNNATIQGVAFDGATYASSAVRLGGAATIGWSFLSCKFICTKDNGITVDINPDQTGGQVSEGAFYSCTFSAGAGTTGIINLRTNSTNALNNALYSPIFTGPANRHIDLVGGSLLLYAAEFDSSVGNDIYIGASSYVAIFGGYSESSADNIVMAGQSNPVVIERFIRAVDGTLIQHSSTATAPLTLINCASQYVNASCSAGMTVIGHHWNATPNGFQGTETGEVLEVSNLNVKGMITNPWQVAFSATSSGAANVTGDGTVYTVVFGTVDFNQQGAYSSATGVFTAPKDGKYRFSVLLSIEGLEADHQVYCSLATQSYTYTWHNADPPLARMSIAFTVLVDMAANETAGVQLKVTGTNKVVDVVADATLNVFSGELVF